MDEDAPLLQPIFNEDSEEDSSAGVYEIEDALDDILVKEKVGAVGGSAIADVVELNNYKLLEVSDLLRTLFELTS